MNSSSVSRGSRSNNNNNNVDNNNNNNNMKSSSVGRSPTETYMFRQGSNDEGLEDDEAEMLRGGGAERVWVGLRGDANNREPLPLPVAHLIHLLGDRGANLANMSGTRWMLALMELILLIVAVVCILTYLITVPRSSTWVWSYFAGLRFSSTVAHIPFIIFQRSVLCSVLALTPSAMGLWLALQRTSSSTSLVRSSSTKSVVSYYLIISVLVIVFCGGVLMQNAVDQQHVEETLAPMLVNLWHNPSGVDGDDVAHLYRRRCAVQHQLQCVGLSICCQMNATSTWVVAEDGKSWSSTLETHEEDGVHVCLIGVGDGRVMDRFTGADVTSTVAAECPRCGDAPSSSSATTTTTTTTQETNRVAAVVDRAGWVEDDGPPRCLDSMVGDLTRSYGFSICVVLIMMMLTSVATVLSYQIFAADSS